MLFFETELGSTIILWKLSPLTSKISCCFFWVDVTSVWFFSHWFYPFFLEENWKTFKELNTIAVGVSIDSVPSKKAWAESLNINNIRLLSDFWPHGNVAGFFGIFREKDGFSERANIIIDEDQNIEHVKIYEISKLPDIDEIITFLRSKLRKEM